MRVWRGLGAPRGGEQSWGRTGSASCEAQGSGIVHFGEKEAQGRPPGSLQLPQEDMEMWKRWKRRC